MSPVPRRKQKKSAKGKPLAERPAGAELTVVEGYAKKVRGGNKWLTVYTEDDKVAVLWFCGTTRRFTPAALLDSIDYLESVCVHGEVWLSHKDSSSYRFSALVKDGVFYGDEGINDNAYHLPWEPFKEALEGAITY